MSACANRKVSDCSGLVTKRGTIYCDKCLSDQKTNARNRHDQDLQELLARNHALDEEMKKLKSMPFAEKSILEEEITKLKKYVHYSEQLQKDVQRWQEEVDKLQRENESLLLQKSENESTILHLHMELEKLKRSFSSPSQ